MSGSDRLGMYNGSKHWNFNKGWKSMNTSRGYSHRGGGDWYKQPYSDKDKYSKTHYHNQSKFRLHNTPRSMFQSGPLDKNRVSKKDNVKLAQKLKHSLSTSELSKEKKQLIKENGLINGLRSESSSVQKKSIEDAKNSLNAIKIINVTSEHKENISSVKSSSEQKSRESISDVLRNKRDKSVRDNASTVTKECEIVELDDDDDNSDSQESKCSHNGVVQKVIDDDDDADCIITEEMIPQKRSVISEVTSEMQIKIVDVATSKEDTMEEKNNGTVMEVDDSSSQSGCEIDDNCVEAGPSVVEQANNTIESASNLKIIEVSHEIDDNASEIPLIGDTNEDEENKEEKKEEEKVEEKKAEEVEKEEEKVDEDEKVEEAEKENKDQESEIETVEEKENEVAKVTVVVQNTEIDKVDEENEKQDQKENDEEKENEEKAINEEETKNEEEKVQDEEKVPQTKNIEEKDKEDKEEEAEEKEEEAAIKETAQMEIGTSNDNEEKLEKAKVSPSGESPDDETEDTESQESTEEKTEDAAVAAIEETSETLDAQSDIGSPKPLMIDETESTESNDARPDEKNDDTTPPKSPDASDNTEQPSTSQTEIEKKSTTEEEKAKDDKEDEKEDDDKSSAGEVLEKDGNIVEELDIVEDDNEMESPKSKDSDVDKTKDEIVDNASTSSNDTSSTLPIGELEENKTSEGNENERAVVHKKRRRKRDDLEIPGFEIEENGVRQKRRSARNAEEIIRKEILKDDEDEDDSSDESNKIAAYINKKHQQPSTSLNLPRPLSPPSLKRSFQELDEAVESNTTKRLKAEEGAAAVEKKELPEVKCKDSKVDKVDLKGLVRDISQEDIKKKLKSLTSKEIEALLLQKIVECITIRGEMGKLREQARASKRTQEATRAKCQQLQKQVEGFEMVLKRITYDKTLNQDKYVQPIKINRSVGLQVNFQSDHGIQNLKQIQALRANASATRATVSASAVSSTVYDNHASSPKKLIKIRSPRKPEMSVVSMVGQTSTGSHTVCSTPMTTITGTTAQITSKLLEASNKRPITLQNAGNIVQILQPNGQQQHQQTLVVNRTLQKPSQQISANISSTSNSGTSSSNANDLIDLTDEEDKNKCKFAVGQTTRQISPSVQQVGNTPMNRVPARVFQAVTTSGVPLSSATNLRLVTTNSQSSPTAIVNNLNGQKVTYGTVVMNGNKQLLLTSNQIRQVSSVQGKNITTLYNKQGLPTLANGQTLRVLQPTTTLQAQVLRHPASLPENTTPVASNPNWKLPPPAPSLKISKVATGIVLSWNMNLTDKFANIASYQLFAYQEVAGTAPSPNIWKKIGDVRALPLPMACTLTQFTEGNNYHFAVRAVDEHSRFGHYSKPGNISL